MREAIDQEDGGQMDLFGDDEKLQTLLNRATDTEPIHLNDIEDWLGIDEGDGAVADDLADLDMEDELLMSPPTDSWLDDDEDAGALRDDPNRRNAALIDSWQTELGDGDDDDDDPYVDWLSDEFDDLGDDLGILSAAEGDDAQTVENAGASAVERARAWGLDDPEQLADFVEEEARRSADEGAPGWLNAVVPGLDRENDTSTDDPNEYARPMSAPGKEFAWVSEIVEEETGEMKAIDPAEMATSAYFRFTRPPAWLTILQAEAAGDVAGVMAASATALSIDANIDELELDYLTFDDYFNFDSPTDKLNAINIDEDTEQFNFVGLDWDDYFDLESPTEKTIAITLDEVPAAVDFDELGLDDDNFEFESSTDKLTALANDDAADLLDIDDIGLGTDLNTRDSSTDDRPSWLSYDSLGDDEFGGDDPDRRSGRSSL